MTYRGTLKKPNIEIDNEPVDIKSASFRFANANPHETTILRIQERNVKIYHSPGAIISYDKQNREISCSYFETPNISIVN